MLKLANAEYFCIEELTGKDYDTVLNELGAAVFRDPDIAERDNKYSGFVTSEQYLSGAVVRKLQVARHYAQEYPEYRKNAEALEKVQPEQIPASDISVRLGASWIDKDIYKQFYCELVNVPWWQRGDVEIEYIRVMADGKIIIVLKGGVQIEEELRAD